ncbi:MAG: hypothetical protein ACOYOF_21135 [Verrucomicrobiaceae bacterium]
MAPVLARVIAASTIPLTQVEVMSFDLSVVTAARQAVPSIAGAWIVDYPSVLGFERLVSTALHHGLEALHVSVSWPLDERRMRRG